MAPTAENCSIMSGSTLQARDSGAEDGPFAKAVEEFLAQLEEKDGAKNPFLKEARAQRLVKAGSGPAQSQASTTELKSFVAGLQAKNQAGRTSRTLARLGPFIDSFHKLMLACENLAQAAPFGVNVAFAGARVVLELAIEYSTYLETVVDALDEIGVSLKCYDKFADAFQSSSDVQDLLVDSYKKILRFWYDVSKTLSRKSFKLFLKSISKSLDKDIKTALSGLRQDSIMVLTLAHATTAQQKQRQNEAIQRAGIVGWIKSDTKVDVRSNLKDLLDRRHDGTCRWMFGDSRFKDWRDTKENAALWYNAMPGSGKSVFAATIADHLIESGEKVVYYFYSFSDSTRRHGINGLRSLALQLMNLVPQLPDKLVDLYKTEMKNNAVTLDAVHVAVRAVHELITQCDKVYVVIDGLDECRQEVPILLALRDLVQMPTYGTAKWLFTSRDHAHIRSIMKKCEAVEVQPEREAISSDICTYFSSHIARREWVATWAEGEDNFLYARLICETLRGLGLTCREDVQKALRRFPKDLNGYYLRSLEKLLERTEEEQELARRTFLVLTATAQPLSLNELLDALAVREGAKNYKASRVPKVEVLKELCSPLVVFDEPNQESSHDSDRTRLKLCHKTVEDFFLQNPDKVATDSREQLRKFFVTRFGGDEELGLVCLTYLQYERYQEPGLDLASILSQSPDTLNHAFLRYAATFWAQHLAVIRQPSAAVDKQVRSFLKSPGFWTCLAVQARVVPYLFGRFAAEDSETFKMGVGGPQRREGDLSGVPLPTWLDAHSEEGMLLDRSLCSFMEEWQEVLTTSPAGLDLCPPLRHFGANCHLVPLKKSKTVRIIRLEESIDDLSSSNDVRLVDVAFAGKTLWADVVYHDKGVNQSDIAQLQRARVPLFSKKHSIQRDLHELPVPQRKAREILFVAQQVGKPDAVEALRVQPDTLGAIITKREHSEEHNVPIPFSQENIGRGTGAWEVTSTQNIGPDTTRTSSTLILHAAWRKQKALRRGVSRNVELEESESDNESDDDDDTDSSDDSDSEDSNDDSDGGSDVDSDSTKADESSETDYESDSGELASNCLIIFPPNRRPIWHAWPCASRVWSRVSCAAHPTLPLLAVSHTARQLELINALDYTEKRAHLSEQSDLQESPLASLRELHFSPCGTYLHFLSISFVQHKADTTAHVAVSTFNFNHEGDVDDILLRERQAQRCSYTFAEPLKNIPPPLTLAYWTDTEVVIALPPLTGDAKILKVSLPPSPASSVQGVGDKDVDAGAIVTLRDPVYFPTSTPRRNPRLRYRDEGRNGEDGSYIYLALDTLDPAKGAGVGGSEPGNSGACPRSDRPTSPTRGAETHHATEPSRVSLPVVLRWKVAQSDGWRAWDAELDGQASDMKRGPNVWRMLRGDFVDSDKAFSVPVRSGLDWTRKLILSCGG